MGAGLSTQGLSMMQVGRYSTDRGDTNTFHDEEGRSRYTASLFSFLPTGLDLILDNRNTANSHGRSDIYDLSLIHI